MPMAIPVIAAAATAAGTTALLAGTAVVTAAGTLTVGGSLIVARISESGIKIEKVCNLDEPARSRMLFNAGPAAASA